MTDKIGQRACRAAPDGTAQRGGEEVEYPAKPYFYPKPRNVERKIRKALQHDGKRRAYSRYGQLAQQYFRILRK